MIKLFVNWMREAGPTAPAFWAIVVGAVLAWLANLLFVLTLQLTIAYSMSFRDLFDELLPRFHHAVLGMIVVAAGIYRAAACHPLAHRKYGKWLAQTPWRYPQSLPLGPIRLVWQDAAIMASVAMMACLPPTQLHLAFGLPWLYPLAYAVTLCTIHWFVGVRWPAVLAVALLGAVIVTQSGLVAAASMIIIFSISWLTINTVLRYFPYSERRRSELGLLPFDSPTDIKVHWLVAPDSDRRWYHRVNSGDVFIGAAIFGWMMFAIAMANRDDPDTESALRYWHFIIALAAVACRLGYYLVEHLPPLTLFGRWKWKQLIILGYDVVFLAPLAAGLTAYLMPGFLIQIGILPIAAFPIATATTIWLAIALPPNWETWHYTGHHRCSLTGFVNSKEEVQT